MRWRFRSRLKSSRHLAAARGHNPGGRFLASCCIRAIGQKWTYVFLPESGLSQHKPDCHWHFLGVGFTAQLLGRR